MRLITLIFPPPMAIKRHGLIKLQRQRFLQWEIANQLVNVLGELKYWRRGQVIIREMVVIGQLAPLQLDLLLGRLLKWVP